jgi:serine/threonine-protein kinase
MPVLAGRYLLGERLGVGGMGEVWQATDELLGRTVAVKVILPALVHEPGFVRRFLAEARAMASVQHPGVVAVHDFHGDDAGAYLVMEFVSGEPLSRVLAHAGRLSPSDTMDLVGQVARALQAVHDRGIVHRDVKPANLLIRADGTVVVADFGIALGTAHTALTSSGAILGTPAYLAPEQVLGQAASPRSDVYALGIVAYECLTGRRPFVGDNPFAVAMQRVGQPPPRLDPDVPPAVAAVVERALAPDPALRWASAAEFAAAASTALTAPAPHRPVTGSPAAQRDAAGQSVPGAPPLAGGPPSEAAPRRALSGRRRSAVAFIALVVVLAGAGVGIGLWRHRPGGTAVAGPPGGQGAAAHGEIPKGFVACGDALCPKAPMCWHGLTQMSETPVPPRRSDCADLHYWETFAAGYLPADAGTAHDLTTLMQRPDIAALCSADAMAAHSRDPAVTRTWRREAWPVQADAYTMLVHCLAGATEDETTGWAFRAD